MLCAVACDCNFKSEFSFTMVGDLSLGVELGFETVVLFGDGGYGNDVIHVDGKDDGTLGGGAMVNAPFARSTLETPLADCKVKRMVPDATGLLHAINAFHEFHDPRLFAGCFETGRLLHEHHLGFGEDAMKESCFDVVLLDVPIKGSSDMKESPE